MYKIKQSHVILEDPKYVFYVHIDIMYVTGLLMRIVDCEKKKRKLLKTIYDIIK